MLFGEAQYHNSPKRAADQVRTIAHREEGLPDGQRRDQYGIGPRYRACRGDERAIRRALVEDARGFRKLSTSASFSPSTTAPRSASRTDGRPAERVLRDSVDRALRGAARGVQGVFAMHQHGGEGRSAHPHAHALLSPRLQNRVPDASLSQVRERWEREVLPGLERQERWIEHARHERTPVEA